MAGRDAHPTEDSLVQIGFAHRQSAYEALVLGLPTFTRHAIC